MATFTYAIQAWWGYMDTEDRKRMQAFVNRCKRWNYCNSNTEDLSNIVMKYDRKLYNNIICHNNHILGLYMPDRPIHNYTLRQHNNFNLPVLNNLMNKHFIYRNLFLNVPRN